ncbi:MAG TPA: ATP-binding protein [Bryobacteraceae bacterium]|nr:ATP-binding protein [Bryobacteraceae bacterium]
MPLRASKIPVRETPAVHQKVKILLVDDTPDNLISLEAALEGLNQHLVLARSGKEALYHLLEDDFAAILLDVKMPDMDGFETAELIRSRERSRNTPILFLTGYKSDEHLFRGYDLGAVDFLFKPIVPEVLRSKVGVFVELSRNAALLREQTTVLREQAQVLQKAEHKFRSLLEAAPDAMVMCRENGEVVMANSRMESLFRYRRDHVLGNNIRMLVPEWSYDVLPVPDEDLTTMTLSPSEVALELRALRSDGSSFPVEISFSPLQTEEGIMITNAIRDITERRRAEERIRELNAHLQELNAHLEERILERTEELLRSNEELQQFAYIASHDLQEPLRTVCIFTQLLAKRFGHLNSDADELITTIVENSRRMEHLIRDLLDFSRLDSRGKDFFKVVDCNAVLEEAIRNLQTTIDETHTRITSDQLPIVIGDPVQLTRLFQNLISNSIKYRSGEPPRIHISATAGPAEWTFSVEDNGMGIQPEYVEKVFGIFKRLHGRDQYPGNGMGLAICRKIAGRHDGRIWVDPIVAEGARLQFTLPRQNATLS